MKITVTIFLFFSFLNIDLFAQSSDSIKTYTLKEITVVGRKYSIDKSEFPVEQDNLGSVLKLGGFNIVRKGVSLAQDIYADGLKRGDYSVVVDGERYQSACPMRMDAPISRFNPIDVQSIALVKSSANLQSGLGGVIAIHRLNPAENFGLESSISRLFGNSNETNLTLAAEKFRNRISFRYTRGNPYKTGNDKSFKDLYGYKNNTTYQYGEASFYGMSNNWKYSASIMYTQNVTFPYLQMDEINSIVYNASLSYRDYKIYFNYTDHLMNNNLRINPMFMETDTKNLTVGFVSNSLEFYYRNWNADNNMIMNNGAMTLYNNMIPKINSYTANYFQKFSYSGFNISGKLGISYSNIGNKNSSAFYKVLYGDVKDYRIFSQFGLNISRSFVFGESMTLSNQIDISAEAPEAQALYVALKRPMGNPYWSGNPSLKEPVRTTLRTGFNISDFRIEAFGSYIFNYVYLASSIVGMQKYQTFGNIDALIAGLNFHFNYGKYLESDLSYTYGENRTDNKALIEILPLQISTKITSPKVYNIKLYIKHTYENAQKRIDPVFGETASSAWNNIDAGFIWDYTSFTFSLTVENILNNNYSRYLSYLRNPFASGMRIVEPGTTIRTNFRYYY
ncbi:MAG: hypothetical protein P8Z35_02645 [Ignavibacteriaceae bacterium]